MRVGGFLRYEWASGELSASGGLSNDRLWEGVDRLERRAVERAFRDAVLARPLLIVLARKLCNAARKGG